jgi:hypothetical protein
MGEWVKATARDGHNLSIYLATSTALSYSLTVEGLWIIHSSL